MAPMGLFSYHKGDYFDPDGDRPAFCRKCGGTWGLVPHHIKRRGAGGKDIPGNRVWLCWKCHDEVHIGPDPFRRLLRGNSNGSDSEAPPV